jgi:nitric oxide reductase subunit B
VNYYEHATYLTSNHGHTALFGVYGMLAIALVLFVWRGLVDPAHWRDRWLKVAFWGLNGGLFLMFIMALLPVGIMQFVASYTDGMWLAKSAEFFNRPIIQLLGNLRAIPDTILIVFGAFPLAWFSLDAYLHMKQVSVRCGEEIAIEE